MKKLYFTFLALSFYAISFAQCPATLATGDAGDTYTSAYGSSCSGFSGTATITSYSGATAPFTAGASETYNVGCATNDITLTKAGTAVNNTATFIEVIFTTPAITCRYLPSGALPVELSDFSAKKEANTIALAWGTASEKNNAGFEIEHSTDSKTWKTIGFVEGNGTTLEAQEYSFTDASPFSGVNYYRLKQIDYDGAFEYSGIVSVAMEKTNVGQIKINPTASADAVTVQLSTPFETDMMLTITNSVGQIVLQTAVRAGENTAYIPVSSFAKGQYNITFSNSSETFTKRFIKL